MLLPFVESQPGISTPSVDVVNFEPEEMAPGYIPEATVKQGASLPPRNDIVPSVIANTLYERGWKTTTLPSAVKPIVPFQLAKNWRDKGVEFDGEFLDNNPISPLEVVKSKLSFNPPLYPLSALEAMLPNYHMDWPRPVKSSYHIYHPNEIIYGHPQLNVDHIRMDASPGYPYSVTNGLKSRKAIFGQTPNDIHPTFARNLEIIRDTNHGPGSYMPVYTLSLKVERRPIAKCLEANTRSIFGGPVDFQVYGQTFYYDLMQSCIENCTSRITIGIDPHSKDWGNLYRRLRRHKNLIETDAKRWDNSQEIVVPAFFVDQFVAYLKSTPLRNRTNGFIPTEHLFKHVRKATLGCLQAYVICMNKLYSVWQQIKSGNFITTLFNCFINDIRWIAVYAVAAIEKNIRTNDILAHYRANTECAFHGDDALLSVSDTVAPWFNAISAQFYWKKIWNIELTPAGVNKDNQFEPFVPWENARFLKRGFSTEDGHTYAPLEQTVIRDMVLWCSDASQNPKITRQNIAAALMEAAHHSREFFDDLERDLKYAANAKNIPWVASTRAQYRQMFRRLVPPTLEFNERVAELKAAALDLS
nr:MAG: nonstructural protein [Riboviria sp.]